MVTARKFFNGKVARAVGNNSLEFLPKRHAFYSCPKCTPEVEGNVISETTRFTTLIKASVNALVLIHQKGDITYELSYGQQPCLVDVVLPDKHSCPSPASFIARYDINAPLYTELSIAKTSLPSHLGNFDITLIPLCTDTCVTLRLPGFKFDFIPVTCHDYLLPKQVLPQGKLVS